MYSLNMPVSKIRTKVRQEFERHRYVNQLKTVDVLLFNSHQEFQVSDDELARRNEKKRRRGGEGKREMRYKDTRAGHLRGHRVLTIWNAQETLNFWKQLTHVLKYFRAEEDPKGSTLPKNFIQGFIEVSKAEEAEARQ